MSNTIGVIESVNLDDMSDFDRINENLKNLILSTEGTIPGSRGFGLSPEIVDLNPLDAKNILYASLDEKVETYIPEILIEDVDIEKDENSETYNLKVYTGENEEVTEEDDY